MKFGKRKSAMPALPFGSRPPAQRAGKSAAVAAAVATPIAIVLVVALNPQMHDRAWWFGTRPETPLWIAAIALTILSVGVAYFLNADRDNGTSGSSCDWGGSDSTSGGGDCGGGDGGGD